MNPESKNIPAPTTCIIFLLIAVVVGLGLNIYLQGKAADRLEQAIRQSAPAPVPPPVLPRWEYKTVGFEDEYDLKSFPTMKVFKLGRDGWEVVAIYPDKTWGCEVLLKRSVDDPRKEP